jgi:hypothetical protein
MASRSAKAVGTKLQGMKIAILVEIKIWKAYTKLVEGKNKRCLNM